MFPTYLRFVVVRMSVPRYVTAIASLPAAPLHIPTPSVPTDTELSLAWQVQLYYCQRPGIWRKTFLFEDISDTVPFCNMTFLHVFLSYLSNCHSLYACNVQFPCVLISFRCVPTFVIFPQIARIGVNYCSKLSFCPLFSTHCMMEPPPPRLLPSTHVFSSHSLCPMHWNFSALHSWV